VVTTSQLRYDEACAAGFQSPPRLTLPPFFARESSCHYPIQMRAQHLIRGKHSRKRIAKNMAAIAIRIIRNVEPR
jgi:hypothetical protein